MSQVTTILKRLLARNLYKPLAGSGKYLREDGHPAALAARLDYSPLAGRQLGQRLIQLFLCFRCFLRYDTFVWNRVDRAVRVLPHSLKRLLRKYNGVHGGMVTGAGWSSGAGGLDDIGNGGSSICFNLGCSAAAPLLWTGWCLIAIDRGTAWGCRWRGLLTRGPAAAAGRC